MPTIYFKMITVVLCSTLLLIYYFAVLRQHKLFSTSRIFLLLTAILPIIIPFIKIPVLSAYQAPSITFQEILPLGSGQFSEASLSTPHSGSFIHITDILAYCGWAISTLLALRFTWQLTIILRIKKNSHKSSIQPVWLSTNPGTPFSFFKWIFWNENTPLHSHKSQPILAHEQAHAILWHSADKLAIELLQIICWWNPALYIIKKELAAVHEFEADEYASKIFGRQQYGLLLLTKTFQSPVLLTNPFFYSTIKRRITMLTQPNNASMAWLRKLAILPVALGTVAIFAFKGKVQPAKANKPITVVIDAGHGGTDAGVQGETLLEKSVALAISQEIRKQAADRNIAVIMTRETDELPIPGSKNQSLKKRVEITAKSKADIFISIHVGAESDTQEQSSGFQVYVQNKKDARLEKSRQLGSAILGELKATGQPVRQAILQNDWDNVYVLENNTVPALLLQVGFLTTPADVSYLENTANYARIASAVLDGITSYNQQR